MSARTAVLCLAVLALAADDALAAVSVSSTFMPSAPTSTSALTANGVASTCAPPKAYPGASPMANGRVQQHAFYNAGPARCVTVSFSDPSCGTNVLFSAYAGALNNADLQMGYLGDAGSSSAAGAFAFTAPADSPVVLVATEIGGNGSAGNCSYTLGSTELGGAGLDAMPIPALTSWTLAVLSGLLGWVMWLHRRNMHTG